MNQAHVLIHFWFYDEDRRFLAALNEITDTEGGASGKKCRDGNEYAWVNVAGSRQFFVRAYTLW